MKIILFGATGYLGSHVAEQLSNAKHEVICAVREGSDTTFLRSLGVSVIDVNFNDTKSLVSLLINQVDVSVCNCIADTRSHVSYRERSKVEIELTTLLFKLSQEAKVTRFIQLSTIMAYGFDRPDTPIDEEYPPTPKYIYGQIAVDREKALLKQSDKDNTELLILRPSNTIGKRDTSFLPNFLKSSRQGMFPVVGGGKWAFSCIDARDVGRAFAHLLQVPVHKPEIFLVKGYDTDWLSFKAQLESFLGKKTKLLNLPKSLMLVVGRIMELFYPFGSTPPLTRFDMEVLSYNALFDDSKIRGTGFTPEFNLLDGLQDAAVGAKG